MASCREHRQAVERETRWSTRASDGEDTVDSRVMEKKFVCKLDNCAHVDGGVYMEAGSE